RRTMVAIETSPSLSARMTSVPPAMKRADRSDMSAVDASDGVAHVLTVTGIADGFPSWSLAEVLADGLEPGLIDLLADHLGQALLFASPSSKARFPMPEGAVPVGHRQKSHMRHVVEKRDRGVEQTIAEALLEVGEREQLLAQLRAVGEPE